VGERGNFYQQAENLLTKDVPAFPVWHYVLVQLVKPYVGGDVPNNLGNNYTKDMYIIKHREVE
jgi:oligopeptide transport system substrate-binding protein